MIQRCQRLVGGILAFLVLLALHLIHGSTLLLALFLHLINHVQLTTSSCNTSTSNINEDDVRLWKQRKVPKCLGVIFVPSARGYFSFSSLRYKAWDQEIVFQGMAKDVLDMVLWCKKLEVDTLLLYDENGIFKHNSDRIKDTLRAASEELYDLSEQTFFLDNALRITLLAREDGKEHMANVTRGISKGVQSGFIMREDIDVNYVQEKLYSSLCPEPDLLFVLGGLHLRLRGFPPWHTRLCEIYHDSSLSLLGPPRLRYSAFRRAMDNYAGCQQRFGR